MNSQLYEEANVAVVLQHNCRSRSLFDFVMETFVAAEWRIISKMKKFFWIKSRTNDQVEKKTIVAVQYIYVIIS